MFKKVFIFVQYLKFKKMINANVEYVATTFKILRKKKCINYLQSKIELRKSRFHE